MNAAGKLRVGIVVGSTRPGRKSASVAEWVDGIAQGRESAEYETVDLENFALPHLDEELPAAYGRYAHPHTIRWARRVDEFDGFVFVTPEYNHGIPGALKDAIDFVYAEWGNKAAGFVSYGVAGGVRAVEQLRLNLATVPATVALSLAADFADGAVHPSDGQATALTDVLDGVETWARALAPLRSATESADAA
ncbi:NADPH-dependent FMN reductase [Microbacterium sp. CIAB417]|uniref:NADPH-dependent FMN reductase n=1 Tax=Microbacterium sp. CIAB417 TaxID=2860287 RepID=UPI001FAE606C|nr:NAD(P)H-dependent oxidoreductase [Microbacterium sp. CIAB417]